MVDFGPTARDYARHRAGFPPALFSRLEAEHGLEPGQRALDLGTGTGTLARGLARRGLIVTGLDVSRALLEQARVLAAQAKIELDLREAPAERTGLPDAAFDVVTAGQCWHWFDRPAAARECRRVSRAGGRLIIAHLDWLAFDGNVVHRTLETISDFGTGFPPALVELGREGMYPAWTRDVREAGFDDVQTFSFDVDVAYSQADWRGRIRASAAVGGTLPEDEVSRFDRVLAARLEGLPEHLEVPHRVWALVARRP